MCGVRPRGWERAVSYCALEEAEAQRGRLGKCRIRLPKEGSRGARCPYGGAGVGGDLRSPRERRVVPGSGKEELELFGCGTFQVSGRWVRRGGARAAVDQAGPRGSTPDVPRRLQTARCTPAWMRWPRSRRSSSVARRRMSRYCSRSSTVS